MRKPVPALVLLRRPALTLLEWTMHGLARVEPMMHAGRPVPAAHAARDAGEAGERAAYFHLRRLGYTVVARRWRAPNLNGEIDLIAWDGETLCFVEVKTRTADDRFPASYAMNQSKWKALRRMARAYVRDLPSLNTEPADPVTRFDLISVYLIEGTTRLEHDKGITGA